AGDQPAAPRRRGDGHPRDPDCPGASRTARRRRLRAPRPGPRRHLLRAGAAGPQVADAAVMKRFWKSATVEEADGGWRVSLDGRPIRTQGGQPQTVPKRTLAEALAEEWR